MLLERNGNYVIEEIKFKKNLILLTISKEEYKISETTYSHFYLYVGRKLSQEELKEILDFQDKSKLYDYIYNLLSKGMYTKKQLENKLMKKKANEELIEEIIKTISEKGYINDEEYAKEALDIYQRKKYGKNKIIKKILDDGISKKIIEKLKFNNEKEKIIDVGNKYIKSHKDFNKTQMKNGLYRFLLNNGFDNEDILSSLDELIENFSCDEQELLKKIIKKYIILHHFDLNNYEDEQKVVSYLMRKGYLYEDIKKVVGEVK